MVEKFLHNIGCGHNAWAESDCRVPAGACPGINLSTSGNGMGSGSNPSGGNGAGSGWAGDMYNGLYGDGIAPSAEQLTTTPYSVWR